MGQTGHIQQDLAYVRGVVEGRERDQRTPVGIALTWSAYMLVGFTWLDFDPHRAAWFLVLASPIGFALSWLIGSRARWKLGEWDKRVGRRHLLHWGGSFLAFAAVLWLAFAGRLDGGTLGQVILIMVGLAYLHAGVHLAMRLFLWLGPMMMIGAVALIYIDQWGWTGLGILVSVGLIASSFIGKADRG